MNKTDSFSSKWAFIFSALGMAIGAGNIWRFPRIAAQNGGGAFLIAWMIALFIWSIPIIILEFAMGNKAKAGVIKAFGVICGKRYCWMGGFIAFCTTAIMFYYSVVTGWCIRYMLLALKSSILHSDPHVLWNVFISGNLPVFFHLTSISLAAFVVSFGISKGIEKINNILIPMLFFLIAIAAARALILPNAEKGLRFLFCPHISKLLDYRIWLEAITQSAWSVGPGWGLILTYAVYSRKDQDIVSTSVVVGLGNNLASILAGIAVICTLFSFLPKQEALKVAETGNVGLTFLWLPSLFKKMSHSHVFVFIFFLCLSSAAFSSLIAMVELGVRVLIDMGMGRKKASILIATLGFFMGIPSAISMRFFCNQDWVWGIGLLLGGFFVTLAAIKYGVSSFRNELINTFEAQFKLGIWFDLIVKYLIPAEFFGLISWWFYKAVILESKSWWNPFHEYSIGTCIFQWGIVLLVLMLLNERLAKKYKLA